MADVGQRQIAPIERVCVISRERAQRVFAASRERQNVAGAIDRGGCVIKCWRALDHDVRVGPGESE